MKNIVIAKRELYESLKLSIDEVTGAGIKTKDGVESIVIFIATDSDSVIEKIHSDSVIEKIPQEFKGNQVHAEVRSLAEAW